MSQYIASCLFSSQGKNDLSPRPSQNIFHQQFLFFSSFLL